MAIIQEVLFVWEGRMVISHLERPRLVCPIDLHTPRSTAPLSGVRSNGRDEQYLKKLRGLGLSADDEWKLANLRPHIWKVSQLIARSAISPNLTC